MSDDRTPKGVKARVDAQRAEAARLRAEGLTLAAIGERLGMKYQRVGVLLRPVPPNHCRKCGGPIERQKRYHPLCLPSYRPPSDRPQTDARTGPRRELTGRRFGRWEVVRFAGKGWWVCRCECGLEKPVREYSLRKKQTRGCAKCAGKDRGAAMRYVKPRRRRPEVMPPPDAGEGEK